MFASWGHLVYRRRWSVLLLSLVLLAATGVALSRGGTLRTSALTGAESKTFKEGLETADVTGAQVGHRLVEDLELVGGDGPAQLRRQLQAPGGVVVDGRVVGHQAAVGPLGLVHGHFGPLEQ